MVKYAHHGKVRSSGQYGMLYGQVRSSGKVKYALLGRASIEVDMVKYRLHHISSLPTGQVPSSERREALSTRESASGYHMVYFLIDV